MREICIPEAALTQVPAGRYELKMVVYNTGGGNFTFDPPSLTSNAEQLQPEAHSRLFPDVSVTAALLGSLLLHAILSLALRSRQKSYNETLEDLTAESG